MLYKKREKSFKKGNKLLMITQKYSMSCKERLLS